MEEEKKKEELRRSKLANEAKKRVQAQFSCLDDTKEKKKQREEEFQKKKEQAKLTEKRNKDHIKECKQKGQKQPSLIQRFMEGEQKKKNVKDGSLMDKFNAM